MNDKLQIKSKIQNLKSKIQMLLVIFVLGTFGVGPVGAQTNAETASIREQVAKYGVGKKVTVKLRDDTKFKGRIDQIEADTFTITNSATGREKTFAYSDVVQVKKGSITKWIVIGAVVGAAAAAILIPLSQRCRNEGANALCL